MFTLWGSFTLHVTQSWVVCKVNEPQRGSCTLLATQIVYNSINIRKTKFTAYIYICFDQNLAKSYTCTCKL